jgi:hypothetical protein
MLREKGWNDFLRNCDIQNSVMNSGCDEIVGIGWPVRAREMATDRIAQAQSCMRTPEKNPVHRCMIESNNNPCAHGKTLNPNALKTNMYLISSKCTKKLNHKITKSQ